MIVHMLAHNGILFAVAEARLGRLVDMLVELEPSCGERTTEGLNEKYSPSLCTDKV